MAVENAESIKDMYLLQKGKYLMVSIVTESASVSNPNVIQLEVTQIRDFTTGELLFIFDPKFNSHISEKAKQVLGITDNDDEENIAEH